MLCAVGGILLLRLTHLPRPLLQVLTGIVFGGIAVLGMHYPMHVADGVIFDGRNVIVLLAAPFGGIGAGLIAGAMTAAFRISEGGAGMIAGVGSICTAMCVGMAYRHFRRLSPAAIPMPELLALSVIVTVAGLTWIFALPANMPAYDIFMRLIGPLVLIQPPATILVGLLLRDMYRRTRLIRQLHDSEERLVEAQLLAGMGDFVWEIPTGRVRWSDGLYELTGYERGTPIDIDMVMSKIHHPDDAERIGEWLQEGIRQRKQHIGSNTYRMIDASGRVLFIKVTGRLEYRDGEAVCLYGSVQDITELVHVREEAERANAAKSAFLAAMSHDLRTPLNAILGFSQLITSRELGHVTEDRMRGYADDIHFSATVLLELVENLLDLSEIEAGKRGLELEETPIAELFSDCVKIVEVRANQKCIDLQLEVGEKAGVLVTDRRSVLQVLLNLVSNAIKFTPEQGSVTLRSYRQSNRIILEVCDTGPGIPAELKPRLAGHYERSAEAHYTKEKGWGLGLTIVKSLTELLDGEMTVENRPEGGACFRIAFPEKVGKGKVQSDG